MKLSENQKKVIDSCGNILVTGGPGSGKTTVSILKAAEIAKHSLLSQQKVLFLSFARASVSAVVKSIEGENSIRRDTKSRIEVETYHSFFWRFLKTHGYLIGLPRQLNILTPPAEAIALSSVRSKFKIDSKSTKQEKTDLRKKEFEEQKRLAYSSGHICFDLFATFVSDLLIRSETLRSLLAIRYPTIILDEFQDTNGEQWKVVKAIGLCSQLIALADPEQRIFDHFGADPARLDHFREEFQPTEVEFSNDNHRSVGTEIAIFGNAILSERFEKESYKGVDLWKYKPNENQAITKLITTTYNARKRLVESGIKDWTVAILVPTKKLTRLVSKYFRNPPSSLPPIPHYAVVDMEATILSSQIIAYLMQPITDNSNDLLLNLLCNFFLGKGGERPTKGAIQEANLLRRHYNTWREAQSIKKPLSKKNILYATFKTCDSVRATILTGDPIKDWSSIIAILENGDCKRLKEVCIEAQDISLFEHGVRIRQELVQDWRDNGKYANALKIVQGAFVQEHFANSITPDVGTVIMNMHKAKGKQFDEVIIFEGWPRSHNKKIMANPDRIVWNNDRTKVKDDTRQNFRVSVTRGKKRVSVLTPENDPCVLLVPR